MCTALLQFVVVVVVVTSGVGVVRAAASFAYTPLYPEGNDYDLDGSSYGLDFDVNSPIVVQNMACFNNNQPLPTGVTITVAIFDLATRLIIPGTQTLLTLANTVKVGFLAVGTSGLNRPCPLSVLLLDCASDFETWC